MEHTEHKEYTADITDTEYLEKIRQIFISNNQSTLYSKDISHIIQLIYNEGNLIDALYLNANLSGKTLVLNKDDTQTITALMDAYEIHTDYQIHPSS